MFPVRRFTVDEYHRLMEAGILKSGDPYELLDGWIVPKMTIHPPHNSAVRRLSRRLNRLLDDSWVIQIQGPVTFLDLSEPEPDVVVAFGPEERYDAVNPGPSEIALVVEVADTSLAEDRGPRLKIYAQARVPIYWIVNLVDRQVEVYTLPRAGKNPSYRHHVDFRPDDELQVALAGKEIGSIPVREILP